MPPQSPLDRPIAVTFFPNYAATTKHQETYSPRSLAERIRTITKSEKSKLPWLKLATFGSVATEKASLRHDANVLAVSGIEADYDGEVLTVDHAVEVLEKQGLAAVVYTSPSHTEDAPRWRVLCPLSEETSPERRAHLIGRLNGLFGGIFAHESWTLSQSYYYGSVRNNPSHRVELIEGTPLDKHDDLDEIWRGPPNTKAGSANGTSVPNAGPIDVEALKRAIAEGESYHTAMLRLAGHYATIGRSFLEARELLQDAMRAVFPPDRDERWTARFNEIDRTLLYVYGKRLEDGRADAAHKAATDRRDQAKQAPPPDDAPALADFLDVATWAARDMPAPDRLLGDLITTTTRAFLVGRTGLGKTLLALAMAHGIATGCGFLHWRTSRPARVLVIDGEMPGELIRQRAIDALRRGGGAPAPGQLTIYARDMEDAFTARFPTLGRMLPLNTEAGREWVLALIAALGGVNCIVFDNVMSLITGDQKDEVPWSETTPLVQALTARRVGQLWLDHTGHNTDRQYGSSTKAWRFDAVGVMGALPEDERARGEVAFTLSFDHPGKARRRTPENWRDFETHTIRLAGDAWSSAPTQDTGGAEAEHEAKVRPGTAVFYDAFVAAITRSGGAAPGSATMDGWQGECLRLGLIDAAPAERESGARRDARFKAFRRAKSELLAVKWISVDGEMVMDLRRAWA